MKQRKVTLNRPFINYIGNKEYLFKSFSQCMASTVSFGVKVLIRGEYIYMSHKLIAQFLKYKIKERNISNCKKK